MLQIKQISKTYVTGELVQKALDEVSFSLRDNEFVAILGPSGSGKTTLLNVIGGLDRYDSGDLIINGISTKKYNSRDWDSYRNHTIGFVFQSYNLIPHQSVLANVELALTISGISRKQRRARAVQALEEVGLGDHLHKKPNQLSGGQMQRVAIARALVNDPDILLADEPTGALDSDTSIQVMELLRKVAKDRLVVMVTHNPELADQYATRILRLKDGRICDDTKPLVVEEASLEPPKHRNMGRASMSFVTALGLSFQNLRTKLGRTLLTAFAGSIGIIGIALILSLSNGVSRYVEDIQKDTMTSYPITIDAQTIDLSSLIEAGQESVSGEVDHDRNAVYTNSLDIEMASTMTSSVTENNLTKFKAYLDDPESEIHQYLGDNGIVYSYDVQFDAYSYDENGELVSTETVTIGGKDDAMAAMNSMSSMSTMSSSASAMFGLGNQFSRLLPGNGESLVSDAVKDDYELLYGTWPEEYDQVIVKLDQNNEISQTTLYKLGLLPAEDYADMMKALQNGEEAETSDESWQYEELCGRVFYLLPACDRYLEQEDGTFREVENTSEEIEALLENAIPVTVCGIIRPVDDDSLTISGTIGYTDALTDVLIAHTEESAVVQAQKKDADHSVLNGLSFAPSDDAQRAADAKTYMESLNTSGKAVLAQGIFTALYAGNEQMTQAVAAMTEQELADSLDQYLENPDEKTLLSIYDGYVSPGTYEDNMAAFGVVSYDAPSSISIYADKFEDKDEIARCIDDYNSDASQEDQISYTDYIGLLLSSVTTIIDVISYVLIAFVGVSLVVSSIMIGIITYISVLERTKEIGILRAIGASKRNISQVFNAETFIIGLCSGALGVGITLLLLIPGNAVIHALTDNANVNAFLPVGSALALVALSMVLTLLAGLVPSRKAARKDPVLALRSE